MNIKRLCYINKVQAGKTFEMKTVNQIFILDHQVSFVQNILHAPGEQTPFHLTLSLFPLVHDVPDKVLGLVHVEVFIFMNLKVTTNLLNKLKSLKKIYITAH